MARIHAEVAIALISMSRLARMGTTMNSHGSSCGIHMVAV
jgi:hypothetical protein